jgi:dGTPase
LLKHFGCLLELPRASFCKLLDENNPPVKEGLDLEWRVFNQLSPKALKCYKYWSSAGNCLFVKEKYGVCEEVIEWWLRVHLIIDHIAGMTDRFALETYQMFEGMIHTL